MSANPFPLALIDGVRSAASTIAPEVDAVFFGLLFTCGAVALVLAVFVLVSLYRFRLGSTAPRPPLSFAEWKLEAAWIAGTTAVFLVFYGWGAHGYLRMAQPPAGAVVIDVVGRQWMWDVRHADGRREFNQIHVLLNEPVILRLTSEDVIHSFAVPAFRLKQDVLPGKTVAAWFQPTRAGAYTIFCDQYCGSKHAEMSGEVIVQSRAERARWLAAAATPSGPAGRGRALFVRYGCSGCHTGSSSVRAPRLEGIAGRMVPVGAGRLVRADDAYLRDSILLPAKDIAAGYAPEMPSYAGIMPEGDVLDIVSYLKSLGAGAPADSPGGAP